MSQDKEVILPSRNKVTVKVVPFIEARALWQAVLDEAIDLSLPEDGAMTINHKKNLMCRALASKKIETCLWTCMRRCLYNGMKIDDGTFEPIEAREDYVDVCTEVTTELIRPFMKSLYAAFLTPSKKTDASPA